MSTKARLIALVGAGVAAAVVTFTGANEGTVLRTYKDAVGVVTSCKGHTGPELRMGQTFTPAQCDEVFYGDLLAHAEGLAACTDVPLTEGEAIAYLDFSFHMGVEAFCGSTMARKLNAGDHRGACAEQSKWVNAGGKPMRGLIRRAADRRAYCERDLS